MFPNWQYVHLYTFCLSSCSTDLAREKLGSKNTRMAPKTHTTYVRISTQRMDTLHTIRWGRGLNQKSMWKKFLHSTKFKCTCVRFRYYNSSNAFFEPLVLCWNIYFWNKQSSLGITYYDHYEALQSVIANDLTCTSFLLKIRLILVRMFQSCFDFKQEKNVLQQQNNELIYPFLNLDELK